MNFTWMAGLTAAAAVAAATWRQVLGVLRRIMDFFVCRVVVKREVGVAVMSFAWRTGRRSPFGLRVFGGGKIFVNPVNRMELVGYESISSDPLLFWFHLRPLIVARSKSQHDKNPNTGEDNEEDIHIWFLRGTINAEAFIIGAIEHYNSLHHAHEGDAESPKRFQITRSGAIPKDAQPTQWGSTRGAQLSQDYALTNGVKTRSIKILKWSVDDIGSRRTSKSAFDGYAFPKHIMAALREIHTWLQNEDWFRSHSIPWRRGWMLHGPPGTGKSTLIRAIAMKFDLPIYVLDLSSLDNASLADAWKNIQQNAPAIALIEDIDTVFDGRKNVSQRGAMRDSLTFDCLLNTISGVDNSDGVFLFVTTNNLEKVDAALGIAQNGKSTRPGRIDRVVRLDNMAEPERRAIAAHILEDCPELIDETIHVGDGETAAQFQNRCAQIALNKFWEKQFYDQE